MTSVYGLRLLRDATVLRLSAVIVLVLALGYRVAQAALVPGVRFGYDFENYWIAARHLLAHEPIYSTAQLSGTFAAEGQAGFVYPPAFAALVAPLAILSPADFVPAAAIWSLLGAAILVAVVLRFARSEGIEARYPLVAGRWRWLLVGAAFALPPVVDELTNGNVHLELVGLLALAWLGIRRGDATGERLAGVAVGIAALVKLFPGLLVLWFLVTGRWRAAVWAIGGAVAVAAVSIPFTGIDAWLQYPQVLANLGPPVDTSAALSPTIWLAPLIGFTLARWLVTLAGVGLVLWIARSQDDPTGYAATVVVALLITPALWTHYLSVLVLPLLLGLAVGRARALALVYILLSVGYQAAFGDSAWLALRVMLTAGALALLVVLLWPRRPGPIVAPVAA